jgi:alpha-L-rhamnosidase
MKHFEPHFTFFGFRYIKIENYPGEINPENFTAVTLYSAMQPTGTFTTSNAMIQPVTAQYSMGAAWKIFGCSNGLPSA